MYLLIKFGVVYFIVCFLVIWNKKVKIFVIGGVGFIGFVVVCYIINNM